MTDVWVEGAVFTLFPQFPLCRKNKEFFGAWLPIPTRLPQEHERGQAAAFISNLSPVELSRRWILGVSWRQKCYLPCGLAWRGTFHEIRPRYLMSPGQNNETLLAGNLGVWETGQLTFKGRRQSVSRLLLKVKAGRETCLRLNEGRFGFGLWVMDFISSHWHFGHTSLLNY